MVGHEESQGHGALCAARWTSFGFVPVAARRPTRQVVVDPSFQAGAVEKIAVFPFERALPAADPNNLAPRRSNQFFRTSWTRGTTTMGAPTSVEYASESEGLEEERNVCRQWRRAQGTSISPKWARRSGDAV